MAKSDEIEQLNNLMLQCVQLVDRQMVLSGTHPTPEEIAIMDADEEWRFRAGAFVDEPRLDSLPFGSQTYKLVALLDLHTKFQGHAHVLFDLLNAADRVRKRLKSPQEQDEAWDEPAAHRDRLVTRHDITKLVNRKASTLKKYQPKWGTPERPRDGSIPAAFSYERILPTLRKQFPKANLPDSLPASEK